MPPPESVFRRSVISPKTSAAIYMHKSPTGRAVFLSPRGAPSSTERASSIKITAGIAAAIIAAVPEERLSINAPVYCTA